MIASTWHGNLNDVTGALRKQAVFSWLLQVTLNYEDALYAICFQIFEKQISS